MTWIQKEMKKITRDKQIYNRFKKGLEDGQVQTERQGHNSDGRLGMRQAHRQM